MVKTYSSEICVCWTYSGDLTSQFYGGWVSLKVHFLIDEEDIRLISLLNESIMTLTWAWRTMTHAWLVNKWIKRMIKERWDDLMHMYYI